MTDGRGQRAEGRGNELKAGDEVVIRARLASQASDNTAFVRTVRADGAEGDLYRVWLAEVERAEVTRDE